MKGYLKILSLIFVLAFSGVSMVAADSSNLVGKVKVIEGKTFEIHLAEVINPSSQWKCKSYDPQYIEFIGESYQAPSSGVVGTTTHIFKFKALKRGTTKVGFETEDGKGTKLYEIQIKKSFLSRLCSDPQYL